MSVKEKQAWTFLTNHSHVLYLINTNQNITIRDIAIKIGITERAVLKIINDLNETDYLQIIKIGRRNSYTINKHKKLRHSLENHCTIEDFLKTLTSV